MPFAGGIVYACASIPTGIY